VLRQQLAVLKRRRPRRGLNIFDKLFWVAVRRFWSGRKQAPIIVTPQTVVRWHRSSFRSYWRLISRVRKRVGRRQTCKEARELIFRMVRENPIWGAPRIHAARAATVGERLGQVRVFLLGQIPLVQILAAAAHWRLMPALVMLAFILGLVRGFYWFFGGHRPLQVKSLGWSEMRQGGLFGILLAAALILS